MRHPLALLPLCISLLAGTLAAQLVMVTPPQVVLSKGQTVQLQAYLYEQSGIAKIVTNTSTWTSLQPTIATVTKTGLVTMKGTGSATIVATYQKVPGYGTVWNQFTPFISVPPSTASVGNIQHVVFIIKENRSFDQYFGTFPGANGATTYTLHTRSGDNPWGIRPTKRSMTWDTNGPTATATWMAAAWTGSIWKPNARSMEITCA